MACSKKEFEDHMSSRCDSKYQTDWRDVVKREQKWADAVKPYDKTFAFILHIWCLMTEFLMDYAFDKFKETKTNTIGSKENN